MGLLSTSTSILTVAVMAAFSACSSEVPGHETPAQRIARTLNDATCVEDENKPALIRCANGCEATILSSQSISTVYCPGPQNLDWKVPCKNSHRFADFGSSPAECWGPPDRWCSNGGALLTTKACSPGATQCCSFSSSCIPCGWTSCTGKASTDHPFCGKRWAEHDCPSQLTIEVRTCAICDTLVVCPSGK